MQHPARDPSPDRPLVSLTLPLPPRLNEYWRSVVIAGAVRVLLSSDARKYHRRVAAALAGVVPLHGGLALRGTVYVARRGTDCDAHLKAPMDTLEKSDLYRDDNVVCEIGPWRRRLDAANPRVEIELYQVTDPDLLDAIAPSALRG